MKSDKTQRGPKGFILLEPGNIMQILPEDNKSWLTLFYSLPEELVSKRPAYMNLPRCPFDVIRSDDYAELLNTDVFLELVWDCYAWSAWQCFEVPNKDGDYREIPGSFNSYSGDFPLWRLSYTIIPYIREKFEHIGKVFRIQKPINHIPSNPLNPQSLSSDNGCFLLRIFMEVQHEKQLI